MAMRGVDGQQVHLHANKFLGALKKIASSAYRCAGAQAALFIFGGVRVLDFLLNVLHRDEALQVVLVVHHQQLFDTVLMEDLLSLLQCGAHGDGDEIVLGHHVGDGQVISSFKAQITVGEDAHQLVILHHGDAGNAVTAHHFQGVGNFLFRLNGYRIHNHAAL